MPSKSPAQARLMRAVAHGWKKPGGGGPTRAVAKEFTTADRREKVQGYNFGGVATGPGMYGGALSRFRQQGGPPQNSVGMSDPRRSGPKIQPGRPPVQPGRPMGPRGRPDPRSMPPQRGGLGQVGQMMRGQAGPQKNPGGRRMVPPSPPRGYPGGGNPMTGGRNPMMRQAANRNRPIMGGRGATSYFR